MLLYISSEYTRSIITCRRTLKALVRLFVYIGSSESSIQELIMVHDDNEARLNMFTIDSRFKHGAELCNTISNIMMPKLFLEYGSGLLEKPLDNVYIPFPFNICDWLIY